MASMIRSRKLRSIFAGANSSCSVVTSSSISTDDREVVQKRKGPADREPGSVVVVEAGVLPQRSPRGRDSRCTLRRYWQYDCRSRRRRLRRRPPLAERRPRGSTHPLLGTLRRQTGLVGLGPAASVHRSPDCRKMYPFVLPSPSTPRLPPASSKAPTRTRVPSLLTSTL